MPISIEWWDTPAFVLRPVLLQHYGRRWTLDEFYQVEYVLQTVFREPFDLIMDFSQTEYIPVQGLFGLAKHVETNNSPMVCRKVLIASARVRALVQAVAHIAPYVTGGIIFAQTQAEALELLHGHINSMDG